MQYYSSLVVCSKGVYPLYSSIKGKVTTDSANHSGGGIFFSSRIADNLAIISSDKVFTHNKFEIDSLNDFPNTDLPNDGTCVIVDLSNWTKKKTADVFIEYEDDNGDFIKTKNLLAVILTALLY